MYTQHAPHCQKGQFWNLMTDVVTTGENHGTEWFVISLQHITTLFVPNSPDSQFIPLKFDVSMMLS